MNETLALVCCLQNNLALPPTAKRAKTIGKESSVFGGQKRAPGAALQVSGGAPRSLPSIPIRVLQPRGSVSSPLAPERLVVSVPTAAGAPCGRLIERFAGLNCAAPSAQVAQPARHVTGSNRPADEQMCAGVCVCVSSF